MTFHCETRARRFSFDFNHLADGGGVAMLTNTTSVVGRLSRGLKVWQGKEGCDEELRQSCSGR